MPLTTALIKLYTVKDTKSHINVMHKVMMDRIQEFRRLKVYTSAEKAKKRTTEEITGSYCRNLLHVTSVASLDTPTLLPGDAFASGCATVNSRRNFELTAVKIVDRVRAPRDYGIMSLAVLQRMA